VSLVLWMLDGITLVCGKGMISNITKTGSWRPSISDLALNNQSSSDAVPHYDNASILHEIEEAFVRSASYSFPSWQPSILAAVAHARTSWNTIGPEYQQPQQ